VRRCQYGGVDIPNDAAQREKPCPLLGQISGKWNRAAGGGTDRHGGDRSTAGLNPREHWNTTEAIPGLGREEDAEEGGASCLSGSPVPAILKGTKSPGDKVAHGSRNSECQVRTPNSA